MAKSRGYSKVRRDEVHDIIWQWIQSPDFFDLERNRGVLLANLDLPEQQYMEDNWLPKKRLVVTCHVTLHSNLGAVSTQRNEAMYSVIKVILNTQVSLKTAFENIRSKLKRMNRLIREKEKDSRTRRPRGVDYLAFQLLIGRVTIWAIEKINPE